jgi:NAD(P)H-hydrate epimerase
MGAAVRADVTVTFIGLKQGMYTGHGRSCCGRIEFSDLGVPDSVFRDMLPSALRMDLSDWSRFRSARPRHAHKGDYGHVLVIGGDYGYAGAARMAAEAAARTGAGLVSLATRPEAAVAISAAVPVVMAHAVTRPDELQPLLEKATVVAIGPGLGQAEWGSRLLARVLESSMPMILDADALNMLARDPVTMDHWVLTPHPGEAARLLHTTAADVNSDRFTSVRRLSRNYGGVGVLKGSGTLVADGATIHVCSGGNPGMASGGMGDVLTGIIAGLAAQKYSLADAARAGVTLHAAAGDAAAAASGERGMLATDLLPWVRNLIN